MLNLFQHPLVKCTIRGLRVKPAMTNRIFRSSLYNKTDVKSFNGQNIYSYKLVISNQLNHPNTLPNSFSQNVIHTFFPLGEMCGISQANSSLMSDCISSSDKILFFFRPTERANE